MPVSTREAPPANRRQVIVGASIGHVLEWYDWVVYLVLSPFFAGQFFG